MDREGADEEWRRRRILMKRERKSREWTAQREDVIEGKRGNRENPQPHNAPMEK
jgi:hypothetical protein